MYHSKYNIITEVDIITNSLTNRILRNILKIDVRVEEVR